MHEPPSTELVDQDEPGILSSWLQLLLRPASLLHSGEEVVTLFMATRPWRRLLYTAPILVVVAGLVGMIFWGRSLSRETLVVQYSQFATEELARLQAEESSSPAEMNDKLLIRQDKNSAFSDMLYRRLLRLNDQDANTRYVVASQMARSNRLPQARRMMSEIAPSDGAGGYPPAHAWLAVDLISQKPLDSEKQEELLQHLAIASKWEGASPPLLALYANVLSTLGKNNEAVAALTKAAEKDKEYLVSLSIMARREKLIKIADDASAKARRELEAAVSKSKPKLQEYLQLASLNLAEGKYPEALQVVRRGTLDYPKNNEQLKYLGSEALRLMYRESISKTPKGVEMNLGLLDLAMKEFPANPNLSTEIALLEEMGVTTSDELRSVMEAQLAEGKATALAHLILANRSIKLGQLREAIPHLELTIKSAPDHPVALNNLSLCLALTDTRQLQRAEALIDRAIQIDGRNPELFDSQGQIRMIAGRPLDAVESLEKAISLDPKRINTRELMVKAYREAGLDDLAKAQEKSLEQLKTQAAPETKNLTP